VCAKAFNATLSQVGSCKIPANGLGIIPQKVSYGGLIKK